MQWFMWMIEFCKWDGPVVLPGASWEQCPKASGDWESGCLHLSGQKQEQGAGWLAPSQPRPLWQESKWNMTLHIRACSWALPLSKSRGWLFSFDQNSQNLAFIRITQEAYQRHRYFGVPSLGFRFTRNLQHSQVLPVVLLQWVPLVTALSQPALRVT